MAGFRHVGYVKDGSNARSFYNPTDTSINFAVPAVHVLAKSATIKPSEIKPGILTQMLDLFRSNHENFQALRRWQDIKCIIFTG
jgi:hypothetical protein